MEVVVEKEGAPASSAGHNFFGMTAAQARADIGGYFNSLGSQVQKQENLHAQQVLSEQNMEQQINDADGGGAPHVCGRQWTFPVTEGQHEGRITFQPDSQGRGIKDIQTRDCELSTQQLPRLSCRRLRITCQFPDCHNNSTVLRQVRYIARLKTAISRALEYSSARACRVRPCVHPSRK